MLVPTRDAKSYGAVHIDNYIEFIGFCKKVDSEEVQIVDVYLDGEKIDSIEASKNIEKISQIYDIDNHAFKFNLKDEHFEKSHLLEFKCGDDVLVNSPIQTIDKNHPKFNENRLKYTLLNLNESEFNIHGDKIGFLALEDNLSNNDFIDTIKNIMSRYNSQTYIAFTLNDYQDDYAKKIFKDENIFFKKISTLSEIIKETKIFLSNTYVLKKSNAIELTLSAILMKNFSNILTLRLSLDLLQKNEAEIKSIIHQTHINLIKQLNKYNYDFKLDQSFYYQIYKYLDNLLQVNIISTMKNDYFDNLLYNPLSYATSSNSFISEFNKIRQLISK